MRSVLGITTTMLTLGTVSCTYDDRPLELTTPPDPWGFTNKSTRRSFARRRRAVVSRSKYMPHIGAKQRGKYPPNMPLHGSLPFYRVQEAPLAMAA